MIGRGAQNITVVIVNHNGGWLLNRCLGALSEQRIDHDVLIIDNASVDGSARQAYETFPAVRIIPLRPNVGFASAVNFASKRLNTEIMVTLNPDTVPGPDFLAQITSPLMDDSRIGAVGSTLVFDAEPGIIASAGIAIHRNGVAIDDRLGERLDKHLSPQPVFGASGGAAAYRLRAFHDAGGFPDSFFMYLEDVDIAWRLRMHEWEAVWAPGAVARHAYSASAGEGSPFKQRLLARNRIWTLVRCLPDAFWRRDGARILTFDVAALLFGLTRANPAVARGRAEAWLGMLPRLCERRSIQRSRSVDLAALDDWIRPPISARDLIRLRDLTGRFSSAPDQG